jgi:diguanylate cyclase (GGDEF)-like protein/putative nucleotidyltransferase with HDIG domain
MKSFSLPTKLYLFLTYTAGIAIFAAHIRDVDLSQPWLLITLCVLASLTLILKVEGSTNRSHYTFSFLVYGFTFAVFGPSEAILVILVSNIVEWIWNKPPWFIQLFNTCGYILVMEAAGWVYMLINPSMAPATWQAALGIIFSMATFNGLNHFMVGIIIWLARGENFKKSGVFDFFPIMLDQTLLYFGASLSFVWNYNPFALGLFLIPLYLIYSTLRVPALERQTEIDSKTGLFNHEYFKKQLNNELARANRFDRPMSIILADLDLLRNINNTYGHLAGDEVLIGVAKAMKQSVRDYDVVCRFGGEEFAILLPETTLSHAYERAELIRKAIENIEFTVPTSMTPIRATMSFGISHRQSFSQTADEITHNADLALYHSKLSGRNRSFAFSNNEYIDFQTNFPDARSTQISSFEPVKETVEAVIQSPQPIEEEKPAPAKMEEAPLTTEPPATESAKSGKKSASKHAVGFFIGALAVVSLLSFAAIWRWTPVTVNSTTFDWWGLIVISALIVLSEIFSIDLYVRQTSVSTSAVPILVAYLIFGPSGVAWASLVLAVTLIIKYRSPISRFVFNFSNHLLAGTLSLALVMASGGDFIGLTKLHQITLSVLSAAILYLITTWMVSFGMSLDLKQSVSQIWKEQFSWLAPYYMGIGLISYALIFGYIYDHVTGLLLLMIPMILLRISQKQYIDRTRHVVTELREKNQILKKNSEEITELNEGLLLTLSEIIDLRDPYVLGHSKQVSKYATEIARQLGLNEKQVDLVRKAGLLHDIGKLGVSMEILTKPGKLTSIEYETIKEHAALGGDLVKNTPSLRPLVTIIRHHHEYFNGGGYPDKLSGNQISIEARIVAVADAIEAMISDRPYRKALKTEQIIDELNRCSGTQFDPLVVKEAVKMLETLNASEQPATHRTETQIRASQRFALQAKSPYIN